MLKKITILIFLLISAPMFSQSIGGSFMLGFPQGEFNDNIDRVGYGLNFEATAWSMSVMRPITFGINVGYMVYGDEDFTRPFSTTNPDVAVDVNRKNSLVNFHLLVKAGLPTPGSIKPYVELLGGGQYAFTTTEINDDNSYNYIAGSTNFDDFAWSYGAGAGILWHVGSAGPLASLSIDLKARYLKTSETEYLKEGDVVITDAGVSYTPSKSTMDMVYVHLGVIVELL